MRIEKRAEDLKPGDVLVLRGEEVHEDLAGLTATVRVKEVIREGEKVAVRQDECSLNWHQEELVTVELEY